MGEVWYIFVRFGIISHKFGFPVPTPVLHIQTFPTSAYFSCAVPLLTFFFFLFLSFRQKWYVVKLEFVVTAAAMH